MRILEISMEVLTKKDIRNQMKALRSSFSDEYIRERSSIIGKKLIESTWLFDYEQIFVYAAAKNEVALTDFIRYCISHDRKLAFPRTEGLEMEFYEVTDPSKLEVGNFGILEPDSSCPLAVPHNVCMLVPGVAFSRNGFRIGYGRGYYDKYLSRYAASRIYTVGIAYEKQLVPAFLTDKFDIAMNRLITEETEEIIDDGFRTVM